jgi:hypothetical protein
MQFVDKTTAMKTFSVVLPVITVSTLLAVFVLTGALQDMQRTISENAPNPGQKLHELMLERPRKRWRKEQGPTSRAPVKMPGEQPNLWTSLAFLAELCFISIPVHEVKEAINLFNLCKPCNQHPAPSKEPGISMSQQHLHSNTTLASSHRMDTGEAKSKTLAREVIDFQQKIRGSRKRLTPGTARRARTTLFNTGRILLLCVWIPLLLLEYVVLLFCWPFMGHASVPMQHDPPLRVSKREQLKHFFTAPFEFLGLDLYQSLTRRRRGGHEHRSPLPPAGRFDHTLEPLPHSYFYPDPAAGDRPAGSGREPHMALAQRLRHVIARPTFQAAYQQQYHSGTNPAAV